MARYTTTNIRLPESEYRDLALRAARRRTSLASLVREAVSEYLGRTGTAWAADTDSEDPVDALIGSAAFEPSDEARQHDHYLYGWPKEGTDVEAPRGHRRPARA